MTSPRGKTVVRAEGVEVAAREAAAEFEDGDALAAAAAVPGSGSRTPPGSPRACSRPRGRAPRRGRARGTLERFGARIGGKRRAAGSVVETRDAADHGRERRRNRRVPLGRDGPPPAAATRARGSSKGPNGTSNARATSSAGPLRLHGRAGAGDASTVRPASRGTTERRRGPGSRARRACGPRPARGGARRRRSSGPRRRVRRRAARARPSREGGR